MVGTHTYELAHSPLNHPVEKQGRSGLLRVSQTKPIPALARSESESGTLVSFLSPRN